VLELTMLHYAYLMMRSGLSLSREDEKGVVSLETVLWVAGLAVLAIATVAVITTRVNTATERIPTGPAAAP
jgi:cytochrome c oxidase assembly factor CtaG